MSHIFNDNASYYASPMDVRKISDDLKKYKEEVGHLSIHNQLKEAIKQIEELNKFREFTQSCLVSYHTQHIDARKEVNNLRIDISSLKETNQDILKKLEEQIQLNSKLCERIFEMKEEKFKDEKS